MRLKQKLVTFTICLSSVALLATFKATSARAAITTPTSYEITVSATIGEPILTIFGWGPANSEVTLFSQGISETTRSDETGYFKFSQAYIKQILSFFAQANSYVLGASSELMYPELCLQAVDDQRRTTQPTCIPPLPIDFNYEIGPVLLSPTISLDQEVVLTSQQAIAQGKTTPNTKVQVFLARENAGQSLIRKIYELLSFSWLVKLAHAYYIPTLEVNSNDAGDFEFELPNDSLDRCRIFVASNIDIGNSAKSNTLVFSVISPIEYFIESILLLARYIELDLYILILVEVLVVIVLYKLLKTEAKKGRKLKKRVPRQQSIEEEYKEFLRKRGFLS